MTCLSCGKQVSDVRVCWCYADLCEICEERHTATCAWFQKQMMPDGKKVNKRVNKKRRIHR